MTYREAWEAISFRHCQETCDYAYMDNCQEEKCEYYMALQALNRQYYAECGSVWVKPRADHKTENSSEIPNNCEHITEDGVTCAKYPACDDCLDNPLNKAKGSERLLKGKDEPQTMYYPQVDGITPSVIVKDEPQIQLTAKCLNCNNSKVCKEKHWDGCVYEPKDEKTCETCRHWKYIAHEWQCEACKCQGYEPKDEPQTCSVNGRPYSECSSCEHFKCTADEPQTDCAWR